jgi:hypothetical protein
MPAWQSRNHVLWRSGLTWKGKLSPPVDLIAKGWSRLYKKGLGSGFVKEFPKEFNW